MASLFGLEVTNKVVSLDPEYSGDKTRKITQADRAYVSHKKKTEGSSAKDVLAYTQGLLTDDDVGWSNATLCMVYNATGDTLKYVREYSWHGHAGSFPYPQEIRTGQWGGFLHERSKSYAFDGSMGCVVYRGVNVAGKEYDWLLGWMNLFRGANHAYCEIREAHSFDDGKVNWGTIGDNMNKPGLNDNAKLDECCWSEAVIGQAMHAVFEAEIKIISHPPTKRFLEGAVLVTGETS